MLRSLLPSFWGFALGLAGAEDLQAPPVTTARGWAIADAKTGKIIAEENGATRQKAGSTAKIMCALVVLNLARENPEVLEETVTVSKLADSTTGSTAAVKAGEQLVVREALYGLLLPSGNDMGNALAEHFNARLEPPGAESPAKLAEPAYRTRCNFIAEMNRTAAHLGMSDTQYFIPYGDGGTETDRTITPIDLVNVSFGAMQNPLFREIVKQPEHIATIRTTTGGTREQKWENTNKLLKLSSYDGIKTGGTTNARACLVARGYHEGRGLIVVVLGSAHDEARYSDARNLFRWAWRQR